MGIRVLITGGAAFIGSHLADELLHDGHHVRVLDSLVPQVHGPGAVRPSYLHSDVELLVGDVRDRTAVRRALTGIDAVYHFAALVGVGQSMYEMPHSTDVNTAGTAVLMEALIERPVQRLVVASSMSLYGEGLYRDAAGAIVSDAARTPAQLDRGEWEPLDSSGAPLLPLATPETKPIGRWPGKALNIGSGGAVTVRDVAARIGEAIGRPHIAATTTGQFRRGDIRHCFADITAAREELGYAPRVSFAAGLSELVGWLAGEPAIDRVDRAHAELAARGLTA